MTNVNLKLPDIHLQVSVYSTGVAEKPSSFDKATKLEAGYRRADASTEVPVAVTVPSQARGRMDHMEVPKGAPVTEGEHQRCGTCTHFSGFKSCEIVVGVIEPEYVCDWWEVA
jgi:hypothetical protein